MPYSFHALCLKQNGLFEVIWKLAIKKRVNLNRVITIDIQKKVYEIWSKVVCDQPDHLRGKAYIRFNLYVSSMLVYGLVIAHNKQALILLRELNLNAFGCQEALKMPEEIFLTEDDLTISQTGKIIPIQDVENENMRRNIPDISSNSDYYNFCNLYDGLFVRTLENSCTEAVNNNVLFSVPEEQITLREVQISRTDDEGGFGDITQQELERILFEVVTTSNRSNENRTSTNVHQEAETGLLQVTDTNQPIVNICDPLTETQTNIYKKTYNNEPVIINSNVVKEKKPRQHQKGKTVQSSRSTYSAVQENETNVNLLQKTQKNQHSLPVTHEDNIPQYENDTNTHKVTDRQRANSSALQTIGTTLLQCNVRGQSQINEEHAQVVSDINLDQETRKVTDVEIRELTVGTALQIHEFNKGIVSRINESDVLVTCDINQDQHDTRHRIFLQENQNTSQEKRLTEEFRGNNTGVLTKVSSRKESRTDDADDRLHLEPAEIIVRKPRRKKIHIIKDAKTKISNEEMLQNIAAPINTQRVKKTEDDIIRLHALFMLPAGEVLLQKPRNRLLPDRLLQLLQRHMVVNEKNVQMQSDTATPARLSTSTPSGTGSGLIPSFDASLSLIMPSRGSIDNVLEESPQLCDVTAGSTLRMQKKMLLPTINEGPEAEIPAEKQMQPQTTDTDITIEGVVGLLEGREENRAHDVHLVADNGETCKSHKKLRQYIQPYKTLENIVEQLRLLRETKEEITFYMICPSHITSRLQAARMLNILLVMQVKGYVKLHQRPYNALGGHKPAPIIIYPIF